LAPLVYRRSPEGGKITIFKYGLIEKTAPFRPSGTLFASSHGLLAHLVGVVGKANA